MSRREDFDGVAQGDALIRCRTLVGKTRTQVAVVIGMEADTYRKYETGQTELRVSQVPLFAKAYGITPRELLLALDVIDEPVAETYDIRAELRGVGVPDDKIEEYARQHEGKDVLAQKAAVRAHQRAQERIKSRTGASPERRRA